jgi:hypothetical protein
MRVRKGVRRSRDRVAEFLGTLLSADYQRGNGDRRTSLVQHGPVTENRQVVRRCMNDQLVSFPHAFGIRNGIANEEPHGAGTVAGRNQRLQTILDVPERSRGTAVCQVRWFIQGYFFTSTPLATAWR